MSRDDDRLAAAVAALERGDVARARAGADAVLADASATPARRAGALHLHARIAEGKGDLAEAARQLDQAVALMPSDARLWHDLGLVQGAAAQPARAADALQRSLLIDERQPRAWNNLGTALWSQGDRPRAIAAFRRATELAPDYAHGLANLGTALRDVGELPAAEDTLERALALDAGNVEALATLASIREQSGRLQEAIRLYIEALRRSPNDAALCVHLGRALAAADDIDGARRAYDEAVRRDPRELRPRLGRALSLPNVPADEADVARARAGYVAGLATLEHELPQAAAGLAADARLDALRWSNFLLAYQGEDDRELQARYAKLIASLTAPANLGEPRGRARGGRTRIGFVSSFLRDGTVGRYFESWITGVDRSRYEVFIYQLRPVEDPLVARLRLAADTFHSLQGASPSTVARLIRGDAPDVLVYPELGMDSATFVLASLRLAPLQCAGWGHPETTGYATIDLFFSSDAMEPPDGERHYTETLVRLPGLGTRYAMPAVPVAVSRAALGLPEDRVLFLCPQSLFKMHPRDDRRLVEVLRRVEGAQLVLFSDTNPFAHLRFRQRFEARLAEAGVDAGRIITLPPLAHGRYLAVNAACDAMLDTSRWSGGNTSLDAIAAGLPIVTQPGPLMRARQSAGMLGLMGIDALIAHDDDAFYAIAERVGRDRAFRAEQARAIVERRSRIFDDPAPVAALYQAIERALAAQRG